MAIRILHPTSSAPAASDVATWSLAGARTIFFAVVDDPIGSGKEHRLQDLLADAVGEVAPEVAASEIWPSSVARQITERLRVKRDGNPAWVLFAAGALTETALHVCTAGDLRIHLFSGDRLLQVTRDHIARNESPEWIRQTYGDVSLEHHETMITRTLGSCSLPPEDQIWPAPLGVTVAICSSALHRYRAPKEYVRELLEWGESAEDGLLFRIDR